MFEMLSYNIFPKDVGIIQYISNDVGSFVYRVDWIICGLFDISEDDEDDKNWNIVGRSVVCSNYDDKYRGDSYIDKYFICNGNAQDLRNVSQIECIAFEICEGGVITCQKANLKVTYPMNQPMLDLYGLFTEMFSMIYVVYMAGL